MKMKLMSEYTDEPSQDAIEVDAFAPHAGAISRARGAHASIAALAVLQAMPAWISVNLLAVIATAWLLWGSVPEHMLIPWTLFMTATAGLHLFMIRTPDSFDTFKDSDPGMLLAVPYFMAIFLGLGWGCGGVLLLPQLPTVQLLSYCTTALIVALLSIPLLSQILPCYLSFLGTALMPLGSFLLFSDARADPAALALLMVAAAMGVLAYQYRRSLGATHKLNSDLLRRARDFDADIALYRERLEDTEAAVQSLRRENLRLQDEVQRGTAALRRLHEGVIITDARGTLSYMNPAAEMLCGWSLSDAKDRCADTVFTLRAGERGAATAIPFKEALQSGRSSEADEVATLLRRDGLEYAVEYVLAPVITPRAELAGAALVFRDAGERRRSSLRTEGPPRHLQTLRRALERGLFELYAQGVYSLSAGTAVRQGCDISLRLHNRDGSIIMPSEFLAVATRSELSADVDGWLIDSVIDALRLGHPALAAQDLIIMPVSAGSIREERFLEYVRACLSKPEVPAQRLCLSIVEPGRLTEIGKVRRFMAALRDTGCCFAIEDFGIGLSAFETLRSFGFDYLKLSAQFIKRMEFNTADFEIVQSLSSLAARLGIRTIAMGVSSTRAVELLKRMGVDYLSGSAVGRSTPLQLTSTLRADAAEDPG